jgi:propanediol dehydratase small subunit
MENAGELTAASGRRLAEVSLEAAATDKLSADDIQISAGALRAQAAIARQAGYLALADNLVRAAELTAVPNAELLRMYELLRPGRSTYDELTELAVSLEEEFAAPETAAFVREAAEVYRTRNLFRRT